ncbi:hypothetical protein [Gordonia hydrophobica]|uniref:Uncharacterized protein n=1 Tax=Gordonia hydrophobica TaxID=40516 RepID=A0ABZ2TYZ5_9ACTN|nr:hypothetical protein [Gordonia hydrophobica]MBM7366545.1 hypothetical protein [Gordonia hydrophobica]
MGLPDQLTARDRRILTGLIADREALWGPRPRPKAAASSASTKRRKSSPARTTAKSSAATRKAASSSAHRGTGRTRASRAGRPLAPRIHFRCERCRKTCWTAVSPRKFCDDCSAEFRGRTGGSTAAKSRPKRLWVTMIPSGIPGSGLRHG